jgi:hypothetical protein
MQCSKLQCSSLRQSIVSISMMLVPLTIKKGYYLSAKLNISADKFDMTQLHTLKN